MALSNYYHTSNSRSSRYDQERESPSSEEIKKMHFAKQFFSIGEYNQSD